jgi:uncharacterized protein YndB with AHSA1/START domain
MPKFEVEKSRRIEAPAERVWPHVREFENWPAWSPWLNAEPDCKLDYRADGRGYTWKGEIVGSGEIEVLGEEPGRSLDLRLTFLEPWKATNRTSFRLDEGDGTTEVTWDMTGSLPFFLFWMKKMMSAWVGTDYERGLAMLKDVVETGGNPSRLEFPGTSSLPGRAYVGVRSTCPMGAMPKQMEADMAKLHEGLTGAGLEATGAPFSIYHKFSPVKGEVSYTIAVPVAEAPSSVPAGLVAGSQPDLQAYVVRHVGPYRHLGNAWSAGMMHARAKVFRQDKSVEPFEIYENDPTEVPESDLVTLVHFPVK